MKTVMVAGKFDPVHDGHIDHIVQASKLGDFLYVVTHRDDCLVKVKGKCNIPLWARMAMLNGILLNYGIKGKVVCSVDDDGGSSKTLKLMRPDIFAKGGDRIPDSMPSEELLTCEECGIEIRYGVGSLLNSSSKIMERGNEKDTGLDCSNTGSVSGFLQNPKRH